MRYEPPVWLLSFLQVSWSVFLARSPATPKPSSPLEFVIPADLLPEANDLAHNYDRGRLNLTLLNQLGDRVDRAGDAPL